MTFVYTNIYTFDMKIAGFDWDEGNWPKCGKHGLSREEIEEVLLGAPAVMADPYRTSPACEPSAKQLPDDTSSWCS